MLIPSKKNSNNHSRTANSGNSIANIAYNLPIFCSVNSLIKFIS